MIEVEFPRSEAPGPPSRQPAEPAVPPEPAHGPARDPADDPAKDLATELRTRGYRMTPQRRMVLDAVEELKHATPEEILHQVRIENPDVNASTIYRTLDLMEQLGLVSHAHLGHGAPSYHSGLAPAHAHLRCGACGEVTELPPEQVAPLVESMWQNHGFDTNIRHLTVNGRCRRCQQQ